MGANRPGPRSNEEITTLALKSRPSLLNVRFHESLPTRERETSQVLQRNLWIVRSLDFAICMRSESRAGDV